MPLWRALHQLPSLVHTPSAKPALRQYSRHERGLSMLDVVSTDGVGRVETVVSSILVVSAFTVVVGAGGASGACRMHPEASKTSSTKDIAKHLMLTVIN